MQRLQLVLRASVLMFASIVVAATLVVGPVPARAASSTDAPTGTIENFYSALLDTMKNGSALGEKGRYERLTPTIQRDFDLPYMARMAVGPGWNTASDAQKQQLSEAFSRYITATYADNFDSYSGEKFQVLGQRTTPYGTIVESRIIKSDGSPVTINYLMIQNGGKWGVGDIYLTGAISQLATLRAQFSSVLQRQGANALAALLNHKAETLVANASR